MRWEPGFESVDRPLYGPKLRPEGARRLNPAQGLCLFSVGYIARRLRPEGARKRSPGFTLGSQNERFALKGLMMRAIRFKGSVPILALAGGPFRATSVSGKLPRVNPGLSFHGPSGRRPAKQALRSVGRLSREPSAGRAKLGQSLASSQKMRGAQIQHLFGTVKRPIDLARCYGVTLLGEANRKAPVRTPVRNR